MADPLILARLCAEGCINRQVLVDGVANGLVYGLVAMGIVLVYRSTRVINFAVGNMGLPGAALFAILIVNMGVPFWLAMLGALAFGAGLAALVELTVVRRLFEAPRVILLIATLGVAQLMQLVALLLPDLQDPLARYPVAIGRSFQPLEGLRVAGPKVLIFLVVPVVALGLALVLDRTTFGKAVAASADNPDLGRLSGINPRVMSTFVWTVAGLLATLSMILLSGGAPVGGVMTLGPLTLTRALTAAVIAGMRSFPRAVAAGVVIGVVEAALRFNVINEPGLIDFVLFIAVLGAVYFQSRSSGAESVAGFAPKVPPIPERWKAHPLIRNLDRTTIGIGFVLAALLPLVHQFQSSQLLTYSTVAAIALCGLSVTVITGWAGQLSLAQMTFAGIGALTAATLTRGLELDIGWRSTRLVDLRFQPVPFGLSIAAAALVTGLLAGAIGVGALRVKGLLLAVSTFAFAIAAQQYLYRRPILSGGQSSVRFERGTLLGLDITDQRRYFYVCLAVLAIVLIVVSHLRRSGVGRTTIAVRDNPAAAAACGVSPTRTKLTAFVMAGGIAGLSGGLIGGLVRNIRYADSFFLVSDSLELVAMVVIGGLGSIAGPLLGALWVVGLPAFWPDSEIVPLLTSGIGLLVVLMFFPGGLVQIAHSTRRSILGWLDRRLAPTERPPDPRRPPPSLRPERAAGRDGEVLLDVRELSVRFGGLNAVNGISLQVGADEVVGLIGTNGAGKTTLMDAVGGFVRSTGRVAIMGRDLSSARPEQRARVGVGRTFQDARLFPELTVRETIQVALEARHRTSLARAALHLDRHVERQRASHATDLIDFLGLGDYADAYTSQLSTGTRRVVEVATLLAVDARLLCLDEPTAGVAQREAEAFGPMLQSVRQELGASILIIEHDMPLIMSLSDRVYCLELGSIIAEGTPEEVRNDTAVVASYLGTDERAIQRSGPADAQAVPSP